MAGDVFFVCPCFFNRNSVILGYNCGEMQNLEFEVPPARRGFFAVLAAIVAALALAAAVVGGALSGLEDRADSAKTKFYEYRNSLGAGGYDIVAYFTENRAALGSEEFEAEFGGETWRFVSAENRDLFLSDPASRLPQYGGHCAYGVAGGYLVRGDPEAWTIWEDQLYFNYNKRIRSAWLSSVDDYISRAIRSWPGLLAEAIAKDEKAQAKSAESQ